jgi:hypothetical protein
MPSIYVDLDVSEFLSDCNQYEIQNLIKYLREDGYLSEEEIEIKRGIWESDFTEKLERLKERYYSISTDDMNILEQIFKKYNF